MDRIQWPLFFWHRGSAPSRALKGAAAIDQTITARTAKRMRRREFENGEQAVRNAWVDRHAPGQGAEDVNLAEDESRRFLRIICRSRRVNRHSELFQLMHGAEVQSFFPHQILVSAWGEFRGRNLQIDVVSALPGVRTGQLKGCDVADLLKALHERWLSGSRHPLLLEGDSIKRLLQTGCSCVMHRHLRAMRSFLAHGVHSARDGTDTLYLAANSASIVVGSEIERFRRLIDLVIAQIDIAFRRVAGFQISGVSPVRRLRAKVHGLSEREEETLSLVAQGRTNREIAEILVISKYTVKNHVQRIMRKLGAANRTEAAAKYRVGGWQMQGLGGEKDFLPVADPFESPRELFEQP